MKDLKVYKSYKKAYKNNEKKINKRFEKLKGKYGIMSEEYVLSSKDWEVYHELNILRSILPLDSFTFRKYLQGYGMYAIVTRDWVRELVKWLDGRKVLEIMSGRGWIAKTVQEEGGHIIATDNKSSYQDWKSKGSELSDIENLSAVDAIKKYGKDVDFVLMAWPPYNEPQAADVVKAIQKVNPDIKIIYIGESEGGCTANDKFFELVTEIEDEEFESLNAYYNPYDSDVESGFIQLQDSIYLYEVGGDK